jgi:hypothetical protein
MSPEERRKLRVYKQLDAILGTNMAPPEPPPQTDLSVCMYAVVETAYEYDDQRYIEHGEVTPKKAYMSREKAEAECADKTLEFFQDNSMADYWDGEMDYIKPEGRKIVESMMPMIAVHDEEEIQMDDPTEFGRLVQRVFNELPTEQAKELVAHISIRPFRVIEIYVER